MMPLPRRLEEKPHGQQGRMLPPEIEELLLEADLETLPVTEATWRRMMQNRRLRDVYKWRRPMVSESAGRLLIKQLPPEAHFTRYRRNHLVGDDMRLGTL